MRKDGESGSAQYAGVDGESGSAQYEWGGGRGEWKCTV